MQNTEKIKHDIKVNNILIAISATIVILVLIGITFSFIFIAKPYYKNCRGIAIFCKQYYNVYQVKEENDTNYEYYYKSIEVKETSDVVYAIMIDWKTETKTEHKFNKNQYVVVINY